MGDSQSLQAIETKQGADSNVSHHLSHVPQGPCVATEEALLQASTPPATVQVNETGLWTAISEPKGLSESFPLKLVSSVLSQQ